MSEDFSGKKVLVVDNSSVMTKIIKNNLVRMGFRDENIFMANDGNQASLMLDFVDFDLVTSSLHLKLKDGLEFLQDIRTHSNEKVKGLPFLVTTSEHKEYFIKELEKAGVTGYLRKPFTGDELRATVKKIFSPEMTSGCEETAVSPKPGAPVFKPELVKAFTESVVEGLGQYMATAAPGTPITSAGFSGDFVSTINLTDSNHDVELTLIIDFPKDAACRIYEGIFGEVELEQVCGVVQELANIVGGNLKPRIAEFPREILGLAHPAKSIEPDAGDPLNFDLGLPTAVINGQPAATLNDNSPKLIIPFTIEGQTITMICVF